MTNDNLIRRQLLQDFNDFARRMRLQYIFHGKNEEPHPFHVKSNWEPPVQPSVALESYLERVTFQLAKAVAFANIFMGKVETELLNRSAFKPLVWKRYIGDIFSLWVIIREELQQFIEQANTHHSTIKFTAEISEITFLDTVVYKGNRFITESVLDVRTHYKATETFQYTHFSSCHPPGVKRGFIEGEALRLLRTNSTKATFEEKNQTFRITTYREGLSEKSSAENSLRSDFQLRIENRPFNKNLAQTRESCPVCHAIPPFSH